MERYVHIASNALRMQAENQRLITSGLANQNTVGFRRDYATASSVYFDQSGMDRVFPSRTDGAVDQDLGKTIPTGNPLDVAISGSGFLAGKKDNGEDVLTRRGDLHVGADRVLRNGENLVMQGDVGPITVPPYQSIEVTRDGTVQIIAPGAESNAPPTTIGRLKLVNMPPANIEKRADGMMHAKDDKIPAADANITLDTSSLEASNINPIETMVDMLSSSRAFELNVKLLATAKELDDQTAKLMRSSP